MKKNRLLLEKQHFNKLPHIWWDAKTVAGQRRYDMKAELFRSFCCLDDCPKILEIGCGDGEFTKRIAKIGIPIIATDLTKNPLKRGEKNISSKHVAFRIENCERFSFNNESFKIVCGISILHHVRAEKALKEAYRVLERGGEIFFTEPNIFNPHVLIGIHLPWMRKQMEYSPNETALSRFQIQKVLKKIGFRDIKVYNYDFLHPSTPVFLIKMVEKISKILERTPIVRELSGSIVIYAKK